MERLNTRPDIEETHKTGNLVVAAVFDEAVGTYFQPYFARSRMEAIRSFVDACNQPDHIFNKHAKDFSLYVLAEWDENDGAFRPLPTFDLLGSALEYIRQPEQLPGQVTISQ